MKKKWFVVPLILVVAAALYACGPAELSNTIDATDGSVSIDTPDDWSYQGEDPDNYVVLSITDNATAFANIAYYPVSEGYDMTYVGDFVAEYYGDNIIGDIEDTKVNDCDAVYFAYSMVDLGEDGSEYNYQGYEYVIDCGDGIIEVDIFYSQSVIEGKLFSPSKGELELLRRIAETAEVNG